ncbi:MAG: hypothetical protein U1D69_03555 [Polynucleobacter sp.]|uniref:hypothetical protein n=1 Tax=Limnobacter sp. TaxID=2003368 RepID=UPI002735018D|nr:hypothetical protein [Limnobacter sp.]MDP3272926.1 hypothetical protein [Limnobacter sp.]MDZ4056033.1 hypothetical protein [Polynucleobacter sp.]
MTKDIEVGATINEQLLEAAKRAINYSQNVLKAEGVSFDEDEDLPFIVAAIKQAEPVAQCNECEWEGPVGETSMCGSIGPLCPDCRETCQVSYPPKTDTPPHPDDEAVDRFAQAMKQKLAQAREKGRSGWQQMKPDDISTMLYEHLEKGDPRDVANFCMFLWSLGQPITPCKPIQAEPVVCLVGMKGSAFDVPETKRAYTYSKQPGNGPASRLGDACLKAMGGTAGDSIDRGLLLLKALQDQGFGVFDLGAEYNINPAPAVAQSWEPDEEACKFLADMITADPGQITRVGFHLGYAKDDEGNLIHGFSVYETEYPEEGVHTLVETKPASAVAVNERLLCAAKKYFMSYCRDEASEFGPDDTGCSQEQHKDALELGEAIAATEAAKGGE